jgi:hypothetical protein
MQPKPAGSLPTAQESDRSATQPIKESGRTWCSVAIPFLVQDAATTNPIPGATIRILPPKENSSHLVVRQAKTTTEGLAKVVAEFPFRKKDDQVQTLESVDPTGYVVEIDAAGYKLLRRALSSYVGRTWNQFGPWNEAVADLQPQRSDGGSRSDGPGEKGNDL